MKTILVPTDTKDSESALKTAASILRSNPGKIIVLHNVETLFTNWTNMSETERKKHSEIARHTEMVEHKLRRIISAEFLNGLQVETLIRYGVTTDEILRIATKENADLLVMTSHRNERSESEFIGSTLQKVVRQAPCPVLVVKQEIDAMKLKRLVVPISLDYDIKSSFDEIVKISKTLGSSIQLLYVNLPQHFKTTSETRKLMNEFKSKYSSLSIETAVYDHFQVEEAILEFVKSSNADSIAMITFEHKHAPGYQLSTTDYILHHSTLPVLAVYDGAKALKGKRPVALA
jgi:nucleotide-binding universal stress UspA family protein